MKIECPGCGHENTIGSTEKYYLCEKCSGSYKTPLCDVVTTTAVVTGAVIAPFAIYGAVLAAPILAVGAAWAAWKICRG